MLSKLCVCMCVFDCVCLSVCVCVSAPRLCGSVTDRMRPLSRRCWGDNRYCSPRCAAAALARYARRGRLLPGLAEEEPGEYGHTLTEATVMSAFAVFFMIRDKIMSL